MIRINKPLILYRGLFTPYGAIAVGYRGYSGACSSVQLASVASNWILIHDTCFSINTTWRQSLTKEEFYIPCRQTCAEYGVRDFSPCIVLLYGVGSPQVAILHTEGSLAYLVGEKKLSTYRFEQQSPRERIAVSYLGAYRASDHSVTWKVSNCHPFFCFLPNTEMPMNCTLRRTRCEKWRRWIT